MLTHDDVLKGGKALSIDRFTKLDRNTEKFQQKYLQEIANLSDASANTIT